MITVPLINAMLYWGLLICGLVGVLAMAMGMPAVAGSGSHNQISRSVGSASRESPLIRRCD